MKARDVEVAALLALSHLYAELPRPAPLRDVWMRLAIAEAGEGRSAPSRAQMTGALERLQDLGFVAFAGGGWMLTIAGAEAVLAAREGER